MSFRRLLTVCTAVGALGLPGAAVAQPLQAPSFVKDVVDVRNGMPDTQVSAVAQTADGFLWLGTRRGLVRFDGLSFTSYTPALERELPSASINALISEPDGSLWISTDKGLVRYADRAFHRIPATEIPAVVTWKVLRDRQQRVWVAGAFGVRVGDGTHFREVAGVSAHIYALAEDASGRIWLAGRDYLAVLTSPTAAPQIAPFSTGERFFDVAADERGTVWAATRHGVIELNTTGANPFVIAQRIATANGEEWAQVWAMTRDARGDLWLGTDTRGVLRVDHGQAVPVDPPSGIRADAVWALTTDRRGRLWAGTSGGLVRYQRSAFHTIAQGMGVRSTWSIRPDHSGAVWATTDDGQVWLLGSTGWRPMLPSVANRMPGSTWPRRDGGIYFADDAGRLFAIDRNRVADITARHGFPGLGPLGLFEDGDGALWASTHNGLLISHAGAPARPAFDSLHLAATDEPRVLMRDRRQRLIVGGPGLTIVDAAGVRRIGAAEGLTDPEVLSAYEDGDRLWIGTADSGLFVVQNDRATLVSTVNTRLRRDIHGIVRDDLGSLWLTSSSGLLRVNLSDLERSLREPGGNVRVRVREFSRLDGLPSNDINGDYQSTLFKDASGGIWLPTAGGPVYFDPRGVAEDTVAPQVHIDQIVIDGVTQRFAPSLTLEQHPTRVDVSFAVTDALFPERARVAYRVIGVDTTWTDLGRRRAITFGPLPGGTFRVEVRAASEHGDWNARLATVDFNVERDWSERWWAVPMLVALVLAAFAQSVRIVRIEAREREERLSRLVAERTADLEASRAMLETRVQERTAALARELDERTQLEQRLASSRKAESLGRLAGGVSHEINNALATVLGFAQLARSTANGNPNLQADIDEVVRAGRRAANITHQLLAFARQQHTPMRRVQIDGMVRELVRSLEQLLGPELSLHTRLADAVPPVLADPLQVEQLLVNLVKNARDAKPRDGTVTISVEPVALTASQAIGDQVLPAGHYVTLAVIDTGEGIAPEVLEHLFEPFYTTKDISTGSGLGLAVCQGIVARHQGAIEVESTVGERTCFRAWFPAQAATLSTPSQGQPAIGGSETLLFVEDEASIRTFAVRMLRADGYTVLDAEDGAAALRVIGNTTATIDCVITDMMMPNVNGLELARLLRATRADLPIVFISGFAGLDEQALRDMRSIGPMIAKPFTQEELAAAVRRALDARRRVADSLSS
ncbi:MAG: response regulator [Gemmatimonadaceae bacterium]|nr:response regulator [Gemmatimonadaceae bacterium]